MLVLFAALHLHSLLSSSPQSMYSQPKPAFQAVDGGPGTAGHLQLAEDIGNVVAYRSKHSTFFIDGVRHDGPYDVETLLAAIENAAANAP